MQTIVKYFTLGVSILTKNSLVPLAMGWFKVYMQVYAKVWLEDNNLTT